jgi:hypothetical protein
VGTGLSDNEEDVVDSDETLARTLREWAVFTREELDTSFDRFLAGGGWSRSIGFKSE